MKYADPDFVTHVMRDPRVWRWVAEDGISPDQFGYRHNERYFQFQDKGFVMFRRPTQKMREIHVAMLHGARNIEPFIVDCMAAMRAEGAHKFLAPIGEWNIPALRLAARCGYIEEGRVSGAYLRAGVPQAMILMGAN